MSNVADRLSRPGEARPGQDGAISLSRRAILRLGTGATAAALLAIHAPPPASANLQGGSLARVTLDLNSARDRQRVRGQWRVGDGLVPGEPNEGLEARMAGSPARLADYDDSAWALCDDVRERRSSGLTFAWYRMTVELPPEVDGMQVAGSQVLFETIADNYGEVWIDGQLGVGVLGNNAPQRTRVSQSAVPGARHVIAVLAANGPLAAPGGAVFLRYTMLAFEATV
jgi:hypothetical protein